MYKNVKYKNKIPAIVLNFYDAKSSGQDLKTFYLIILFARR